MQAAVAAALAEAANQLGLGKTGETLADQPIHQVETGGQFHEPDYAAQSQRVKASLRVLDACRLRHANDMDMHHISFKAPTA